MNAKKQSIFEENLGMIFYQKLAAILRAAGEKISNDVWSFLFYKLFLIMTNKKFQEV